MKQFQFLTLILWAFSACPASAQSVDAPNPKFVNRQWSDVTGNYSISATLASADQTNAELRKPSGESVRILLRRLSDNDREYVDVATTMAVAVGVTSKAREMLDDLQAVLKDIETVAASDDAGWNGTHQGDPKHPATSFPCSPSQARHRQAVDDCAQAFAALHQNPGDAVSALLAGTLLATGKDTRTGSTGLSAPLTTSSKKWKEAEKYLEESLSRLRKLHRHFPEIHPQTLASALNNRAVLALKIGQKGRAASLLIEAAQVQESPQVAIIHNIALFRSLAANGNPLFQASVAQQKLMQQAVDKATVANVAPHLPRIFYYTTAFNQESDLTPGTPTPTNPTTGPAELWPELTCFVCSGTAFIDCAACIRGTTSYVNREPIAINPLNGDVITGNVVRYKPCSKCGKDGAFQCKQCKRGQISP
jgi:hypothetical protein